MEKEARLEGEHHCQSEKLVCDDVWDRGRGK